MHRYNGSLFWQLLKKKWHLFKSCVTCLCPCAWFWIVGKGEDTSNEPVNSYKKVMFYPAQKRCSQEERSFSVQAKIPLSYTNIISPKLKEALTKDFLGSQYSIGTLLDLK